MSDAVFPTFAGLAWSITRTPQWSTGVKKSLSGRRYAVGNRMSPTWRYKLPHEVLRQYGSFAEWAALVGFVNARRGMLQDFLYRDPNDSAVTGQAIGLGDGVTRAFPLLRDLGGFVEPVYSADVLIHVAINGVDVPFGGGAGQFNVDAGAPNVSQVIFGTPPPLNAIVSWSGTYYWRCSFLSDAIPFEEFMQGLWKVDIEFESHAP